MSDGQVEFLPFADGRLGRHVRHDPRNREHPSRRAIPRGEALTVDVRHRNYSRFKLCQFRVGACTGFTGAQALNTGPNRERRRKLGKGLTTNTDALAYYSGATARDPWQGTYPPIDTGSSGQAVAEELVARGEADAYVWAFGYDHGLASLPLRALMQGTWWTEGMFEPEPDGRVRPTGDDAGGHEYLWVGFEKRSKLSPSKDRSWFLNSWEDEPSGNYWGVTPRGVPGPGGGYFYMERDDHEYLLERDGDLIGLVT